MQDKPDNTVLIVGCGDIGRRVAGLLPVRRSAVTGCVRSRDSAAQLQLAGIRGLCIDLDETSTAAGWAQGYQEIYYFAPPPTDGRQDPRMRLFLGALDETNTTPRRIVYISTSAVYGDCQGDWITEAQAANPSTDRGHRRLDAEQQLAAWSRTRGTHWTILRVAGIYGPGKLPLARLQKGLPVLSEADSPYTNRIHADDLAAICVAAMRSQAGDTIYNVSDGHPSNMTDYFFRVADAAGLPRPPTVTRAQAAQQLSAGVLSFLNDSRRMRNEKMLNELGIELQYPGLAAGLASCLGQTSDQAEP